MWSLATRLPKRFVIPRSSSSTAVPLPVLLPATTASPGAAWCRHASTAPPVPSWAGSHMSARPSLKTGYTGLLVAGTIFPLMMAAFAAAISACSEAGTLLAKVWYGAS